MRLSLPTTREEPYTSGLGAAWGVHACLLALAVLACYGAPHLVPSPSLRQWALTALLGLGLALWALLGRHGEGARAAFRATVALAAAVLRDLARSPRLGLGPDGMPLPGLLSTLHVDVATLVIVLLFFCWLGYRLAGGERWGPMVPLRRSALVAAALLAVLAVALYTVFRGLYGAADLSTARLLFQVGEMALLLTAVLGATGGPLVRRWPGVYLGTALVVASGLGLVFGLGGEG